VAQCLLLCNASSARIPWKNKSKFPFFFIFFSFFLIFHHFSSFFPLFFHFLTLILPFLIFGSFFPLYFSLSPFFAHPPLFCVIFCGKFELRTPWTPYCAKIVLFPNAITNVLHLLSSITLITKSFSKLCRYVMCFFNSSTTDELHVNFYFVCVVVWVYSAWSPVIHPDAPHTARGQPLAVVF